MKRGQSRGAQQPLVAEGAPDPCAQAIEARDALLGRVRDSNASGAGALAPAMAVVELLGLVVGLLATIARELRAANAERLERPGVGAADDRRG